MKQALGLVEIQGLSTAVVVADTMAKAANIQILEIENTKGLGYMTIKLAGDVGAVNAAVNAGRQIGIANQKLVSWKVIPRPSDYVEHTFCDPTPPDGAAPSDKEEGETGREEGGTEGKAGLEAQPEGMAAPKAAEAEIECAPESDTDVEAKVNAVGAVAEAEPDAVEARAEVTVETVAANVEAEAEPEAVKVKAEVEPKTVEANVEAGAEAEPEAVEAKTEAEPVAPKEAEVEAKANGDLNSVDSETAAEPAPPPAPGVTPKKKTTSAKNGPAPKKSAGSRRKNKGDSNTI